MILRTPPLQKKRRSSDSDHETPVSDRRLVVFDDNRHPQPVSSFQPSDQMFCTYNCRQMVKSDFLVALSTAEREAVEYRSRAETLSHELQKSEDERKNCREHLHHVEQELEASKGREHSLQERLLKEVTDSQERYHAQLKRCSELEVQVKKEVDSRKKVESLAAETKERATALEGELQRLSESSRREKDRLRKDISHLQDELKLSVSRINAELERTRLRANTSEKEAELLRGQLKEIQEQFNECLHEKTELDSKLSTSLVPIHEPSLSEGQNLVKHLQEELRNYEAEVHEARKLKSSHENIELLKEKLREEKSWREKAEVELSKLQEVQLNAEKVEHELLSWKSLLKEIPDVSCLDDILRKFARLQKEALESMMTIGDMSTRVKELEVAVDLAELSKQQVEKESALAKEKAENSLMEIKRLEQMLSSVMKERDLLKKDDPTLTKLKSGLSESGLGSETVVQNLEKSLAQKESVIREVESSLHEQREVINRQHDEIKLLNERLSAEARRVKSMEREGDRLRAEISLLESKLGHGDFSAANTKVLRMVNTLAVDNDAKHTIEALRAELQKTQAKLQAIEELKGQSDSGNIIDTGIPEKLAQLKGQIAILEKREERYKTVFAERISVFRRACCSLFGYKIVMDDQHRPNGIPVTRFTLQSIYAQSDGEKLEFDYESGNTNILVNEYTSQPEISHQVEVFIRKMNSIPAFTANLTMESFNKRTLS
ncbi:mitotic spindle checkpoint protein MAD1 [Iris pallida]|uniref:Mitotic spindle checkpoint protein MAD1 n=1 Tax=Iris pallida TaxID=29817 RepID=A0AAX6E2Z1_IRIPA|nr:mitotic spindle checkpoint protein MAD1 [Iris pallida]